MVQPIVERSSPACTPPFCESLRLICTRMLAEIAVHYERGFKEISKRFFTGDSWPKVVAVAPIVNHDKAFLTLYRILYYKHQLMTVATAERPADNKTYIEAFVAYEELVKLIEADADVAAGYSVPGHVAMDWALPHVWVYELFAEYLYHCEKFQKRRSGQQSTAGSEEVEAEPSTPGQAPAFPALPSSSAASSLNDSELSAVWAPADVLKSLHAIVDKTGIKELLAIQGPGANLPSFRLQAGYFALVALARLYGKLGDVSACLECARPLGVGSPDATLARNVQAHATVVLSVAWSLAFSRRFDESLRLVSRSLRTFQQTLYVLDEDREDRGPRGGHYMKGQAEKLLQLAAVLAAACPGAPIDDNVRKPLNLRHGDLINDLSSFDAPLGVGGAAATAAQAKLSAKLQPTFDAATPGFMAWITNASSADAATAVATNVRRIFAQELAVRRARLARVRASNLRMYTSISASKMAAYANENLAQALAKNAARDAAASEGDANAPVDASVTVPGEPLGPMDMRAALTSLKVGLWLASSPVTAAGSSEVGAVGASTGLHVSPGSGALHVVLAGETAKVDEARTQFNVAGYFVSSIEKMNRLQKDLHRSDRERQERRDAAANGEANPGASYNYGGSGGGGGYQGGAGKGGGGQAQGGHREGGQGERRQGGERRQEGGNPAFSSYAGRASGSPAGKGGRY